jgi:hypothetical protein
MKICLISCEEHWNEVLLWTVFPITVASRYKECSVFYGFKSGILGSDPTRGVYLYLRLYRDMQAEADLPSMDFHQVSTNEISKLRKSDNASAQEEILLL